jgi:predicted GIY-YIG superfamily endonuclease
MKEFYFVYILESILQPENYYTGQTKDVISRLKKHNEGGCPHTAKFKPWQIKNYFAFNSKEKALKFEKYLKSGSGKAFAQKHF